MAETFLAFSPRVHYREPRWVFADVGSTSHLFGGEAGLLQEVQKLTRQFFPGASAAVADTPATAQVVTQVKPFYIVPPQHEPEELRELPLSALIHLEGLIAWRALPEVESLIDFFYSLGLKKIGELQNFSLPALRERWGETGATLWRRLHGRDRQVISPLLPTEPLTEYVHFDFAVGLLPLLLHSVERGLQRLFARLQGRGEFAAKVLLHLHCEYSGRYHLVEVKPVRAGRQLELYMKLIENRLAEIDLENPIKEFSIEIIPCSEKIQQLDFWEPREKDQDKLHALVSVLQQAQLTTGFLRPRSELMPEESWELTAEYTAPDLVEDEINVDGVALQLKPAYSSALNDAPRPSRLLPEPKRLSAAKVRRLKFVSPHPVERIEAGWWDTSRGRDYYFVLSPEGQAMWIYHDRVENEYYLHGFFD